MEVTRPEETTVKPKEKQMSATQVAHEIMSAGKNRAPLWAIVKKNSPKKPVGQLSTNRLPTANQQATNSWPTDGRRLFWGALLHNYSIMFQFPKCCCFTSC